MDEIEVTGLGTLATDGAGRARATVAGEELYFEADDAAVTASPELFATTLLPIAALAGSRLRLDAALEPLWRRNAARTLRVWSDWWGTPSRLQEVLDAPTAPPEMAGPLPGTALCFTLGVDSFHTLLRSGYEIDELLFAHGYDVPLADSPRLEAASAALAEVAAERGCRATIVRTNLWIHPVAKAMDWERSHGGPIAALGHGAVDRVGEVLISSTKPVFASEPWGSHFRTDPGWSSTRLRVTHLGAEYRRNAKVAQLVDEPLVQRHLRVCWENRSPTGNCGACEKCVRTMLIIAGHGRLGDFSAFPEVDLVAAVEELPVARSDVIPVYKGSLEGIRDRRLRRAVTRLIRRTQTA